MGWKEADPSTGPPAPSSAVAPLTLSGTMSMDLDDFIQCVQLIISQCSNEDRHAAESRISSIVEMQGIVTVFCEALPTVEEMMLFFICIGLQRIIWKRWRYLSNDEKQLLLTTISSMLLERGDSLQQYARGKLEQVMANVCAQLGSVDPVVEILQKCESEDAENHRKSIIGLSVLRGVLDEVLNKDDPRLTPEQQKTITKSANTMIVPATTLACSALERELSESSTIMNSFHNAELNTNMLEIQSQVNDHIFGAMTALETLKVIIIRVHHGPHISTEVLELLFEVAKLSASSGDVLEKCSVSAIECLTEIMQKRFIPSPVDTRTYDDKGMVIGVSAIATTASHTWSILQDMTTKAINLLQGYTPLVKDMLEASPLINSLLEFISVFSSTHLERCLKQSEGQQLVLQLVEALTTLTRDTSCVEITVKITRVWEDIFNIDELREYLIQVPSLSTNLAEHLMNCALCTKNEDFRVTYASDVLDENTLEPFMDPHISEIVSGVSLIEAVNHSDTAQDARVVSEELSSPGLVLTSNVVSLLGILSESADTSAAMYTIVLNEFQSILDKLQSNTNDSDSNSTDADVSNVSLFCLDLSLLARILPIYVPKETLLLELISLLGQLAEAKVWMMSSSRAYGILWVTLCEVITKIVKGMSVNQQQETINFVQMLINVLPHLNTAAVSACDFSVYPPPKFVSSACLVVILEMLQTGAKVIEAILQGQDPPEAFAALSQFAESLSTIASQSVQGLSLESHILLCCSVDQIESCRIVDECAAYMSQTWIDMMGEAFVVQTFDMNALLAQDPSLFTQNLSAQINYHKFGATVSTLTGIIRHSNGAILTSTAPSMIGQKIVEMPAELISAYLMVCFMALHNKSLPVGSGNNIALLAINLLTLTSSLLQSLGSKAFLNNASIALQACVWFVEECGTNSDIHHNINDGTNISINLCKQMLLLAKTMADSTSSSAPNADMQAQLTLSLLSTIAGTLSKDEKILAELLENVLTTGAAAIRCYWKRRKLAGNLLARGLKLYPTQHQQQIPMDNQNGNDAQEIVGGVYVKQLVVLLSQLCVASLGPDIPPQDVLTALEGITTVIQEHTLMKVYWFFNENCWQDLLGAILRALLLRYHTIHKEVIEDLLGELVEFDFNALCEEAAKENQQVPQELENGTLPIVQQLIVGIAAEFNCVEVAGEIFASIGSVTLASDSKKDMVQLLRQAFLPLAAEIAKIVDTQV